MPMTIQGQPIISPLDYESRPSRRSWGPWIFWPRRWSLLLTLMIVGVGIWLRMRHEAWKVTATLYSTSFDPSDCPTIADNGRVLVTHDDTGDVRVFDTIAHQQLPTFHNVESDDWLVRPANRRF